MRDEVPWIIIITHYPMYCSDPTNPMCPYNNYKLQNFTKLFKEYNVDLFLSAHQHDYERDKPFYNNVSASYES
jgi:acid phosphatase type 7